MGVAAFALINVVALSNVSSAQNKGEDKRTDHANSSVPTSTLESASLFGPSS